jgi:hypothetical protein
MRDIQQIISELEQQQTAIEKAILALRGAAATAVATPRTVNSSSGPRAKKHRLSDEGRQRIAEAARKRWAAERSKRARRKRTAA